MEGEQKLPHSPDQKKNIRPGRISAQKRHEKLHAVFARGTFPGQNVRNTLCSDHCWKFGRAQRLPPRRIVDDHDGGLCFEPVVVVVVVVVDIVDIVDGAGAGGVGAVRGGNLKK